MTTEPHTAARVILIYVVRRTLFGGAAVARGLLR